MLEMSRLFYGNRTLVATSSPYVVRGLIEYLRMYVSACFGEDQFGLVTARATPATVAVTTLIPAAVPTTVPTGSAFFARAGDVDG